MPRKLARVPDRFASNTSRVCRPRLFARRRKRSHAVQKASPATTMAMDSADFTRLQSAQSVGATTGGFLLTMFAGGAGALVGSGGGRGGLTPEGRDDEDLFDTFGTECPDEPLDLLTSSWSVPDSTAARTTCVRINSRCGHRYSLTPAGRALFTAESVTNRWKSPQSLHCADLTDQDCASVSLMGCTTSLNRLHTFKHI
jgi:hypothetical protein